MFIKKTENFQRTILTRYDDLKNMIGKSIFSYCPLPSQLGQSNTPTVSLQRVKTPTTSVLDMRLTI